MAVISMTRIDRIPVMTIATTAQAGSCVCVTFEPS